MLDDLESLWRVWAVVGVVTCCVLPVILFGVALWMVRRYLNGLSDPDVGHLHQQLRRLVEEHPDDDPEDLVREVIRSQAVKSGVVGALTGLGGFMTLPIALPADLLLSLKYQASTVQFIAESYGHTDPGKTELEIRRFLIMSGGARVSRSMTRLIMEFAVRFVGKSLAKFIPFLGALVGFAVNYAIAHSSGLVALKVYSGEIDLPGLNSGRP